MTHSVIVHGPQGCGKTQNCQALARHFGLRQIVDNAYSSNWPRILASMPPTLFLTHERPQFPAGTAPEDHGAQVIAYVDAARAAGVFNPVNQTDQE